MSLSTLRERLAAVRALDPEGADRLTALLERWERLSVQNVYGETFTARQFSLVAEPLVSLHEERARLLELLSDGKVSLCDLSAGLRMDPHRVFGHVKELLRRDLLRIVGFREGKALLARTGK